MRLLKQILLLLLAFVPMAIAGWSQPIRLSNPGGHQMPQILVMGDTVHVVAENFGPPDRIGYYRSTDRGVTWSNMRVLSADSNQTLFPKIIGNGNRLMVLWRNDYYLGGLNIGYATSTNNGASWSSPRYVFSPNRGHLLYYSVSGESSTVNIIFNSRDSDSLHFYFLKSTNFGQSWSSLQEMFRALQSGVPDQADNGLLVHFVWDGRFDMAHPWEIHYIRSTNGGVNWSSNIVLSDTDQFHSVMPSICINGPNSIGISWMDYKYSPYPGTGDIMTRSSSDSGQTWGPERQATFDHFAWNSVIASDGDTIHIVCVDESTGLSNRSIYYTRSTDNGESWSEPYWIDGTLDDSADPAITVSNERVYVVWTDGRLGPDSIRGGLYISRFDPESDAVNEENDDLPEKIAFSAYPNPFNSNTTLSISGVDKAEIAIYDITGRLVTSLHADNGKAVWDATGYSSGVYFARVRGENSAPIKLILLK